MKFIDPCELVCWGFAEKVDITLISLFLNEYKDLCCQFLGIRIFIGSEMVLNFWVYAKIKE